MTPKKQTQLASQKIFRLPAHQQDEIVRLTDKFRRFLQASPSPFEIGEYLYKLKGEWNEGLTSVSFTDFFKSLDIHSEFQGKRWAILNYYRRLYRIYQDYELRSTLLKVEQKYAAKLSSLIKPGAGRKARLSPTDLLKSREEALEYAITGKMTPQELGAWIKNERPHTQERSSLKDETEIIEALLSQRESLKQNVGIELREEKELITDTFGRVDLAGRQGDLLVMIEVEIVANYEDVGQLLSFVGEMTIKRVNGQCTMYQAGKKARDKKMKPISVPCTGVTGWLVAKSFEWSAFYAAYGQQVTFWIIRQGGNLLTFLDMKTAAEADFEKFLAS